MRPTRGDYYLLEKINPTAFKWLIKREIYNSSSNEEKLHIRNLIYSLDFTPSNDSTLSVRKAVAQYLVAVHNRGQVPTTRDGARSTPSRTVQK